MEAGPSSIFQGLPSAHSFFSPPQPPTPPTLRPLPPKRPRCFPLLSSAQLFNSALGGGGRLQSPGRKASAGAGADLTSLARIPFPPRCLSFPRFSGTWQDSGENAWPAFQLSCCVFGIISVVEDNTKAKLNDAQVSQGDPFANSSGERSRRERDARKMPIYNGLPSINSSPSETLLEIADQ